MRAGHGYIYIYTYISRSVQQGGVGVGIKDPWGLGEVLSVGSLEGAGMGLEWTKWRGRILAMSLGPEGLEEAGRGWDKA